MNNGRKTRRRFLQESAETAIALGGLASLGPLANAQLNPAGGFAPDAALYQTFIWGSGDEHVFGDTTTANRSSPVQLAGSWILLHGSMRSPSNVALSGTTYGIASTGVLYAWGRGNSGQLGTGAKPNNQQTPAAVAGGGTWKAVSGGSNFATGVKTSGELFAWGAGTYGALGDGTTTGKSSPVQIGTATDWSNVSSGDSHSGAIKYNGQLWMWGYNGAGGLGDGSVTNRSSPVQVAGSWLQVACGYDHTVGLRSDGTLWGWGSNAEGAIAQATNGTNRSSPVQFMAGSFIQIAAAQEISAMIRDDFTLWIVGNGKRGALGNGTTTSTSVPVQVPGSWSQVSVGAVYITIEQTFVGAIKTDGTLWMWGANTSGQLGLGNTTDRTSPVQVGSLRWNRVECGGDWTVAHRAK